MADNTTLPGAGDVIATDDIAGVKYQIVKLALGAPDTATLIAAGQTTKSASVPVAIASDSEFLKAEDAAHSSGDVGIMALARFKSTPAQSAGTDGDYSTLNTDDNGALFTRLAPNLTTVAIATAGLTTASTTYASGDVLGTAPISLATINLASGRPIRIRAAWASDDSNVIGPFDLFFFSANVSPGSDNAAFSLSDADNQLCIGMISFPGAVSATNNRFQQVAVGLPLEIYPTGTGVWAVPVTRTANAVFASGATALKITLGYEKL